MARIRYDSPTQSSAGLGPIRSLRIPDPDTLPELPKEVRDAADKFRRLDQAVTDSWASLSAAVTALDQAKAEDEKDRRDAIREGRKLKAPRGREVPATAVLTDAQAVYADTVAIREEAAAELIQAVVGAHDTIAGAVADRVGPLEEEVRNLALQAEPLRRELRSLREWTGLEYFPADYERGEHLGPSGTRFGGHLGEESDDAGE